MGFRKRRLKAIFQTYEKEITAVKFTPDNQNIISSHSSGYLQFWNIPRQESIAVWKGHSQKINSFDLSPRGDLLITVDTKSNLKVWQIYSFDQLIARGCYQVENFLDHNSHLISMKTSLCQKKF